MDKGSSSELFVNDGSFMERFKQLQQENQEKGSSKEEPKSMTPNLSASMKANTTNTFLNKRQLDIKPNNMTKPSISTSGGKLAFSLKQKSKISVAPVKLGVDEDEPEEDAENAATEVSAKRQKSGQADSSSGSSGRGDVVVPAPPSDLAVRNVADKLASFVAKNGRQFENITRQRNPGDSPFKFLFDLGSADYKYYEYRLLEEEKLLAQQKESQAPRPGTSRPATSKMPGGSERSGSHQHSNYQTPASALYDGNEGSSADTSGPPPTDPIAMMEFYMKKAAQEERKRQPKQSCGGGRGEGKRNHNKGGGMAESGGRWGRGPATAAPPVVSVEGEGRGIVGVAGEERWRHFDSSVNAVSFGFVATAILIAMFLVMAIFERFLRPRARAPPPSRRAWHRRLWGFAGDPHSPPQHLIHDGDSPHHLRQAAFAGKLDQLPPPKVPVHAQEVSVLMPGQAVPTFIAHPAPPPCPREPVAWPSHHSHIPLPGGAS